MHLINNIYIVQKEFK